MSESSVKDILKKFSDGNGPPVGLKPVVPGKPGKAPKPDSINVPKDHSASNGTNKSSQGPKPFAKPSNVMALNLNDLTSVKLKKPPLPKPPGDQNHEDPKPEWLQPKPKPKPVTAPRHVDGPSLSSPLPSPSPALPISPTRSKSEGNDSALHPKPAAKPTVQGRKPKPLAPHRKDSLNARASPTTPAKPGFLSDNKENNWKNLVGENEPPPPISDSENSSGSSLTDLPMRRRSFLHDTKSSSSKSIRPMLQPLPPLTILGPAPRKPARPPNVTLDRFKLTGDAPAPHLPPKPSILSADAPTLPARPSVPIIGSRSPKAATPLPVPEEGGLEDSGEIYDDVDVEGNPPPPEVPSSRRPRRPFSLIETMDSDEEQGIQESDDIYDDAESTQAPEMPPRLPPHPVLLPPTLPPHQVLPPHPTLTVTTPVGDAPAPPPPSITSIPALHGSGGSSISFSRSVENSGSGLEDCGEIYDDVSGGEDTEELYEALDVDEGLAEMDGQPRRPPDQERNKKEEERLKKEQEKQQKKEEEKRKKKEKEEKKKKEKEEKDLKKKFNIKGDINVIEMGIVLEEQDGNYGKLDLQCKAGEKVEILRKEGNPPGMWLARNLMGQYGYVDHQFVRVEGSGGDFGDVYDDVIAEEETNTAEEKIPEDHESSEEDDCDNIYDAVN